jgi:hypothetical protein
VTFLSWAAISDVLRSVTPLVFFDYPVIVYLFFLLHLFAPGHLLHGYMFLLFDLIMFLSVAPSLF